MSPSISTARMLTLAMCLAGFAAEARERFRFEWATELTQCPDQRSLEASISARLGYSPFDTTARRLIRARVSRAPGGLSGLLELFDSEGAPDGKRVFHSPTANCSELASSMELAITIAIDPQAVSADLPQPVVPQPMPSPARPAPPPPEPLPEPVHFSAGLTVAGEAGFTPGVSADLGLHVAIRYRAFVAALEGWADLPGTAPVVVEGSAKGSARTNVQAGSLLGCGTHAWLGLCGVVTVAALQINGDVGGVATRETVVVPLVGARASGHFLVGSFDFQPFAQLDFVLRRVSVVVGGTAVWVTPTLAARIGLTVTYQFF